jgi:hypothetical protein
MANDREEKQKEENFKIEKATVIMIIENEI